MRITFLGSEEYTIPIVEVLKKHGLNFVVTTQQQGTFVDYLKKEQIDFISSKLKSKEDIAVLKKHNPILGILASYGVILPQEVIDTFPNGIINIHPSLLPLYKGTTPIQTTILQGDQKTGVTVHFLDEQLDHGPIVRQEEVTLTGKETTQDLLYQLFKKGAEMIDHVLESYEKTGKLESTPQEHQKETVTKKLTRDSGYIDINSLPSQTQLERMIRAYYPWPGVWTTARIQNKELRIKFLPSSRHPERSEGSQPFMLQVEGKKPVSYKDFLNGYPEMREKILPIIQ